MAWTWMLGVVEPIGDHFTTGPTTASRTNIGEFEGKVVRRIWRQTDAPYVNAANHAQMLVNNGKFVVPTLFDGAGPSGNEFRPMTLATFRARCIEFANAMQGICSVVEIVNEVNTPDHAVGAKYWSFFREAYNIFHPLGIEPILSGVPNRASFLKDADDENIWSYATGGVGIHAYHPNPGSSLTTSGTGLYYLNNRRRQLDGLAGLDGTPALGAAAAGRPIWLTEFGWVTKAPNPAGNGGFLLCTEAQLATRITQAHNNFVTHAEYLKLAASCYFTWPDWTLSPPPDDKDQQPFRYSGIRSNETGRYQTGPNGGNVADWDYRVGVQVAQDADTLKPTLAGTLPGTLPGTASGLLEHAPGLTIRYAQGVPATLGGNLHYANDALYFADMIAAGKRPLACLGIGRSGTWAPMGWTLAERTAWIQRWVDVLYAAGVRDFEVGNEIENPADPYLSDYWEIFDIASPIIRAKAGTTVILTSTLGPGADQLAFLEDATTRGKWALCDAAALHPYSTTAGGVPTKITDARAAGRIPAAKDIYITEIGIGSDNGGSGFTTTEAGQATFITSVFNSLTKTFIEANRIRLACLFVYANYLTAGDTTGNWDNYSGLRRANGNYKPAWDSAIAAGYGKGLAVPWYYKNGGGRSAIAVTTGRNLTAKEALDAFGEGTVGTGSAPVSVTGEADQVTQTTARLKGTVDPNSLSTSWFYEYSEEPLP